MFHISGTMCICMLCICFAHLQGLLRPSRVFFHALSCGVRRGVACMLRPNPGSRPSPVARDLGVQVPQARSTSRDCVLPRHPAQVKKKIQIHSFSFWFYCSVYYTRPSSSLGCGRALSFPLCGSQRQLALLCACFLSC